MAHPAIEIIHDILDNQETTRPAAWRRLKKEVWDLPLWAPGCATLSGGTNFRFQQDGKSTRPILSLFASEQQVRASFATDPYMPVPFKYAIYLANEKEYDLDLFLGDELLTLNYNMLCALRDFATLQYAAEPVKHPAAFLQNVIRIFRRARSSIAPVNKTGVSLSRMPPPAAQAQHPASFTSQK